MAASAPVTDCPSAIGVDASQRAATGTLTATVAVPVTPSADAETVTVPAVTPLTSPAALIVATAGVSDVQVNVRPVSAVPDASKAVAAS